MRTSIFLSAFVVVAGLAACGGSTVPAARMATAQSSIGAAQGSGAEHNPTAALYLQYAREQYAQAQSLSRDGDGERAEYVLRRAEADAELARELSRREAARNAAQQAQSQARTLPSQGMNP